MSNTLSRVSAFTQVAANDALATITRYDTALVLALAWADKHCQDAAAKEQLRRDIEASLYGRLEAPR